ncbi:uncharacterized protein LOC114356484 [Ostrinia furnacalis]|uniref:uncharacterized protein LOC114356484 n=1 Tax=Ostrinia furnacalis TaxID=93504 RepID=UPI00103AB694|nr:uncharacterized protein LOC114356484 [Ostrinia furnacalis]
MSAMEPFVNYNDKVVIVTGASSGIGAEAAKYFAKFGARLTLVGRNEDRLLNTSRICEEEKQKTPVCLLLDLTHKGSCEAVISKTVEVYGKIDVLVNCAGVSSMSSVFDKSIEIFDDIMAINLRVPFYLTQLAVPHLMKTKGNIVNVSFSMMTRFRPGFLVHNMAKIALERFAKQAAPELGIEGVRINCVSPGITRTNILSGMKIENPAHQIIYEKLESILPQGKVLEPKEVAAYICLVASDVFPHMNGGNLVIDGASSLI